jgi:hypothetical protein
MLGKIYSQLVINSADLRASLKGPLATNGYYVVKNYFDENDLIKFDEVSQSLEGSKEYPDILKKFPFLSKPLFDPLIINIIREYLGGKAVLDYASGRRFLASGSKSDTWHHDSVGHRIKIFLCINDQDESTHTELVPKTHLIKYKNYRDSRIDESEITRKYNPIKVVGQKNDLIIFDTNLLHKGIYSDRPREIVQFEFSDKRKSMLSGHVGIRKSVFDKSILNSPLIYKKKVKILSESVNFI